MFVEVLLPLPLYSTFTYSVPEEWQKDVQTGSRVLVQFGKKKYYTGIVEYIHSDRPKGFEIKPIIAVLDSEPIVRYPQLKFWNWMADYYLCSPGEVFKAAMPTGLKPESETFLTLNREYEPDEEAPFRLSDKQEMLLLLFQEKNRLKISDIENETGIKNVAKIVNPLIEHNILEIDERVTERYRPKKVTIVELCCKRGDMEQLHDFFNKTSRSRMQEKAIIAYLDLSGWMTRNKPLKDVEKKTLTETAEVGHGVIKALEDKGIFKTLRKSINRFTSDNDAAEVVLSSLSGEQHRALREIETGFSHHDIQLLHGVTGSGKTEIYSHLISQVLKAGNQALFLVPEISLTTQLSDRLKRFFGDRLLVYHSKFSDSERVDIWKKLLHTNEPLVVLGVRSSIFLPFSRLGLIIIDEEHETSFKQYDPAPRYNARDAALMLAKMHGAKALLGSATPSVESYYKAKEGKYGLIELKERFEGALLPDVEIIDMKVMRKKREVTGILSSPLKKRILETLKDKKQSIIFQNRRGYAPMVVCQECGWTPKCLNCDVSLVYHRNINLLKCHYCGFSQNLPKLCPACGLNGINIYGYGTERISEDIAREFPQSKVIRMDLDTTRNKDAYQEIIEDFAKHETDILVGTQMVSKGLDFSDVLTVGVVNADTLLNFPDFRSNERAFNMLEQVSGRAGRRKEKGKVVIQTVNPDHEVLRYLKAHDFTSYYENEIRDRKKYIYPPFSRVINIYIKNKDNAVCDEAAVTFALALRKVFGNRVLGPEKPFVSRVATYYIQTIMLKVEAGASMKKVKDLLRQVLASQAHLPQIKTSIIYYDVDPT